MKLHPYIPPINATVRTIDGLIGTVENVISWSTRVPIRGPHGKLKGFYIQVDGEASIRIPEGHTSVSIYNIRPCIRE